MFLWVQWAGVSGIKQVRILQHPIARMGEQIQSADYKVQPIIIYRSVWLRWRLLNT